MDIQSPKTVLRQQSGLYFVFAINLVCEFFSLAEQVFASITRLDLRSCVRKNGLTQTELNRIHDLEIFFTHYDILFTCTVKVTISVLISGS